MLSLIVLPRRGEKTSQEICSGEGGGQAVSQ